MVAEHSDALELKKNNLAAPEKSNQSTDRVSFVFNPWHKTVTIAKGLHKEAYAADFRRMLDRMNEGRPSDEQLEFNRRRFDRTYNFMAMDLNATSMRGYVQDGVVHVYPIFAHPSILRLLCRKLTKEGYGDHTFKIFSDAGGDSRPFTGHHDRVQSPTVKEIATLPIPVIQAKLKELGTFKLLETKAVKEMEARVEDELEFIGDEKAAPKDIRRTILEHINRIRAHHSHGKLTPLLFHDEESHKAKLHAQYMASQGGQVSTPAALLGDWQELAVHSDAEGLQRSTVPHSVVNDILETHVADRKRAGRFLGVVLNPNARHLAADIHHEDGKLALCLRIR